MNQEKNLKDNIKLMSEWDWEKNTELGYEPEKMTIGSHKKVWWKCEKGHEWQAIVKDRTRGTGCPYCSGNRVLVGYNDFASCYPEVAKSWDYLKNGNMKPTIISCGSNKKYWWKCEKGHEWQASPHNRRSTGCPICDGKKTLVGYNDLGTLFPEIVKEWNYNKNKDITPAMVTSGSNRKVWWTCKVCKGEYEAIIANRTKRNSACPFCAGQKVLVGFNDLQTKAPDLVVEWSDKNVIGPTEVTPHSKKKVYWTCPLGHDDYLMSIGQRSMRQGCPICAQQSQTSFPEQALYFYIKEVFPDALNRYIIDKREIDIFIPSKKIGIEYNGYFSHKKKTEKDVAKKEFLNSRGIYVVVIKEYKVEKEKQNADFFIHERTTYKMLSTLIKELLKFLGEENIDINCERDAITIKNQYVTMRKENSIAAVRPDLVQLWDYEKNGSITPEMVTIGTGQRFYWKCRICNRSYLNWPSRIAEGSVCAKHRNLLKKGENDLVTKHPELLRYWDYEKNDVDPAEIFGGGEKVVYWKCEKGHSYKKSILKRIRGEGCPVCAGKKVLVGVNDLKTVRPDIAKMWNYEKNGIILPSQVTAHSNKTIWWICDRGHEWEAKVSNRANGRGCPYCYKEQRGKKQLNMYDASTLLFISSFESIRDVCNYLNLDYDKKNSAISNVCNRKQKTLMGKYVLRYASDDEFMKMDNV